ncbi:hypothetical protein [Massilia sp. BKSP1R2A-1]|jgi:hypothetical protein|uniref:hypothetical protein n=1 Tax=Massilia sp. BKSP1R2A-1 TaxID=3422595 RepID=UPI003D338110
MRAPRQRWNWVQSADLGGRWITTQGYAEVTLAGNKLHATLRFHAEDGSIYQSLEAILDEDGVEATVRSSDPTVAPFHLGGTIFQGDPRDGVEPMMMLLTDGTTVLSLAHGPHSDQGNL